MFSLHINYFTQENNTLNLRIQKPHYSKNFKRRSESEKKHSTGTKKSQNTKKNSKCLPIL